MSSDGQSGEVEGRAGRSLRTLGLRLRRLMPRVAMFAGALFVLRLLIQNTSLYRDTPLGILGPVTFCLVSATLLYYGLKLMLRLKRALLWRVRRRLIVTYLFVGLTPLVLLALLGFLAAMGGSRQVMVRVVTVQFNAMQQQVAGNTRVLATELSRIPATTNDRAVQSWLDERAGLLQASLPGARLAAWRGPSSAGALALGQHEPARFVSGPREAGGAEVGAPAGETGAPLPAWLEGRQEWTGMAFIPPPTETATHFAAPSLRALARAQGDGQSVALLVVVPVSRPFVQQMRETTGLNVRPYFLGTNSHESRRQGARINSGEGGRDEGAAPAKSGTQGRGTGGELPSLDFSRDQFGDTLPDAPFFNWYPVFLPATNWLTSEQNTRWSFIVDWSWDEGGKQFWGDAVLGPFWQQALYGAGVTFLILELLALLSAAWMTRAVTGTVHKLHRATQSVMRGDFSHRIRTRSRDQLGELVIAFNEMSSNIESLLSERVEHERLEREIEIAAEVQAQLFPRGVPALSTVEVAGECRAARGVAGDYYDYIEAAPGLVVFALGDVSGKGLSASLVMSNLQATLRAQVAILAERLKLAVREQAAVAVPAAAEGQAGEMPCGVTGLDRNCAVSNMAAGINDQLCRSTESNRFATLFLALYDDRTRTLRYTNAGHNSPILIRDDGSIEQLTTGGTMVGAFDWVEFEEGQTTLAEGDLLVIFSDGLSEAQNAAGEEYGEERIIRFAAARRRETANNLRAELFDEVDAWAGAVERGDDQTLVILKAV